MNDFIQIKSDDYIVRIDLENILYEDTGSILKKICMDYVNWERFFKDDKLWYCDDSGYLTCIEVNHEEKIIVFS